MIFKAGNMTVFDSSLNDARVEVAAGTVFEIALPEQAGTGFKWKIVSGQAPVTDFRDPAAGNRGGEKIRHFQFRAEDRGEMTISLQLGRSWERDKPPAKTFTIYVEVR